METNERENRAALKEKAHSWKKPYQEALDAVVVRDDATIDDLIDVIWERGILGRIAPLDSEEKQAREQLGSDVWKGTRDDPELYLRILYAAAYLQEAQKRRLTAVPSAGYAGGAIGMGYGATLDDNKWEKFFIDEARKDPISAMSGKIMDRAREMFRVKSGRVYGQTIPWGAEGVFKGIPVVVDRYTIDGMIVLRAENIEDHMRLGESTSFGSVSPVELNPDDFKIPEPPDKIEYEIEIPGGRAAGTKILDVKRFLTEHHIVTDYDNSWQRAFWDATRPYEGKQVRVKITFEKGKGILFEVVSVTD